jgi:hypothetical protein
MEERGVTRKDQATSELRANSGKGVRDEGGAFYGVTIKVAVL